MNYGVTGRQQDGAALQQDNYYKFPVREAILFRRSRIKRPKEALLKKPWRPVPGLSSLFTAPNTQTRKQIILQGRIRSQVDFQQAGQ